MVRQMVGDEVPLAWCGGDPAGNLGTSVEHILKAIDAAWSDAGVAILVDLGGAETTFGDGGRDAAAGAPGKGGCLQRADRRGGGHRGNRSLRWLIAGHCPTDSRRTVAAMNEDRESTMSKLGMARIGKVAE
jgi:hypothetical protein